MRKQSYFVERHMVLGMVNLTVQGEVKILYEKGIEELAGIVLVGEELKLLNSH